MKEIPENVLAESIGQFLENYTNTPYPWVTARKLLDYIRPWAKIVERGGRPPQSIVGTYTVSNTKPEGEITWIGGGDGTDFKGAKEVEQWKEKMAEDFWEAKKQ